MTNFITHDFKLPNHANELSKAEDVIEKIKCRFKSYQEAKSISNKQYLTLYEETIRVLDYVGQLSLSAFNIENEIEELYFKQFKHSPELAKKLWLEHYEKIHHPYDILKNRCFKLLDEYDELYFKLNKTTPPNWSTK
jgi:hypothetical protein